MLAHPANALPASGEPVVASGIARLTRYDRIASVYKVLTGFGSLGQIARLYRAVAAELDVSVGGTVVELGCGPATLTPYLIPRVGPSGTVIGVDLAEKMIARARRKAGRMGWHNARFECVGALDYAPPSPVDAVVFCLALSTMSDCERCLERALAMLKPGGKLVILDSIPEPSQRLASAVMHLKAPLVGARPTRAPLDFAAAELEDVRVQRFFAGVYALVSGRRPAPRG